MTIMNNHMKKIVVGKQCTYLVDSAWKVIRGKHLKKSMHGMYLRFDCYPEGV